MADVTFRDVSDQVASMLGADSIEELPEIDSKRVHICVNQAYRECYSPLDGKRPRWASRQESHVFSEDEQVKPLSSDIIDIDKYPILEGHGPLSPMNARTDEVLARSYHGGDFKPVGIYRGRFPSIDMEKAEKDRPIWYFVDQSDEGTDSKVTPRLVLYPIPNKTYTVSLNANIVPQLLEEDTDLIRLPGDLVYDILLPIAQLKMLNDPRYNGDNKEIIMRSSAEARKRLSTLSSPQKHKNLRLQPRSGW